MYIHYIINIYIYIIYIYILHTSLYTQIYIYYKMKSNGIDIAHPITKSNQSDHVQPPSPQPPLGDTRYIYIYIYNIYIYIEKIHLKPSESSFSRKA